MYVKAQILISRLAKSNILLHRNNMLSDAPILQTNTTSFDMMGSAALGQKLASRDLCKGNLHRSVSYC